MLERIDCFVQMPARQVQVDAGCLEIGMAEQYLDRSQIGTVLQQVRGKTMPQHVGTHALFDTRVLCRIVADIPDRLIGQVIRVLSWLTWKEPCLGLLPTLIFAERFEESGAERHIAVLASFALVNVDDHAFAVDVAGFQIGQLRPTQSGGVERHQHRAVERDRG